MHLINRQSRNFDAMVIILHLLLLVGVVFGLELDTSSKDSICAAGAVIQDGTMNYYDGTKYGGVVGMFSPPYYWWEAGEAFGSLLDYWFYCDNDTYADILYDGMLAQTGDDYNFIPANQSLTEGNDDQGFWVFVAMAAAERNFTQPTGDTPSWTAMVQAAYNSMWARWDTGNCGGGLRWQIFTWNSGYDYKNTISNGCLFHIAARLARYTANDTYADVATQVWDWTVGVGYIGLNGDTYDVYDGASVGDNCTDLDQSRWSYNLGLYMAGAAYLYNYTEEEEWKVRATDLLNAADFFLNNSILFEPQCMHTRTCNNDQRSFRSIFSRCLGLTGIMVPDLQQDVLNILEPTAEGVARSCSGGTDGVTCGQNWAIDGWDGLYGLGEQIASLEAVQNLLAFQAPAPYTEDSGGTSRGDSSAGMGATDGIDTNEIKVKQKDRVGAGILTSVVLLVFISGAVWMII